MIIDAHHHLWDLDANYYPWLSDRIAEKMYGDYSEIRRNYLIEDFLADADSAGVVASVHVQAGFDPERATDETVWIDAMADDEKRSRGFPAAIIGQIPPEGDVAATLAQHVTSPRFRGVRHIFSDLKISSAELSGLLTQEGFSTLLTALSKNGLLFEIQARPDQAGAISDAVKAYDGLRLVICHAGMPIDQSPDGRVAWKQSIARYATIPGSIMKLSGFGMFDARWSASSIQYFINESIEKFGANRCVCGSNYPVERLSRTYKQYWEQLCTSIEKSSEKETDALLFRNASNVYGINTP